MHFWILEEMWKLLMLTSLGINDKTILQSLLKIEWSKLKLCVSEVYIIRDVPYRVVTVLYVIWYQHGLKLTLISGFLQQSNYKWDIINFK